MPAVPPPALIGTAELATRWGITRVRIWQLIHDGKMPPGQKVSGRVWLLAEIEAYEASPDGAARLARMRHTEH
jgi:predicted DNA-binding transcriptional regulator AlpA